MEISKIGDAGITWMDELLNTSSSEFNDLKKLAETAVSNSMHKISRQFNFQ